VLLDTNQSGMKKTGSTLINWFQYSDANFLLFLSCSVFISSSAVQSLLKLIMPCLAPACNFLSVSDEFFFFQGILDALVMTMKHLVAVCTVNQQSIILQKSHEIIVKSVSCPTELFKTAFQNFEQLVSYPSSSVQDLNLISLFASVVTALSAETPLSPSNSSLNSDLVSNLFLFFLLRGHVPAAQALGSIMNKNPIDQKAFGSCLSILSEDNKLFFKKDIILGFAWIGKGLAMKGDDRSKEIIRFLLKLVFSSQHGLDVALSAADGLHVIMGDTEGCLSKQFHAVIKPLYKQRLFSSLLPVLLSSMKEATYKYVQTWRFIAVLVYHSTLM
jgi:DNA repair/transcription protein MET18/MMS19